MPTGADIDRLPLALRRYVRDVETKNDLAETIRENFRLHQEIEALRKECARLAIAAGVPVGPPVLGSGGVNCLRSSSVAPRRVEHRNFVSRALVPVSLVWE